MLQSRSSTRFRFKLLASKPTKIMGSVEFLGDRARDVVARLQCAARTTLNVYIGIRDIATVIRDFALLNQADLVIIGRRCVSGIFGELRTDIGSLIRESRCTVLSVSMTPQGWQYSPTLIGAALPEGVETRSCTHAYRTTMKLSGFTARTSSTYTGKHRHQLFREMIQRCARLLDGLL